MSQRSFSDHVKMEKDRKVLPNRGLYINFVFSKEDRPEIRRKWIKFVKTKWKDFTTPTMQSVLCEKFFTADCDPMEYSLKNYVGVMFSENGNLSSKTQCRLLIFQGQ